MELLLIAACAATFVSLPYWLPGRVVRLRNFLFTRINGQDSIRFPADDLGGSRGFLSVYGDRRARGRSEGAVLSDLFWYWLAPGPEMHQEHLEDGERYERISRLTLEILGRPQVDVHRMLDDALQRSLDFPRGGERAALRLRDRFLPVWADFFHQVVFGEPGTERERQMIRDHAHDLVTALKCCGLRHMKVRNRLTDHLIDKIETGALPFEFPSGFSTREQAHNLQGTYFTTGVVQMSDATAHVLMAIAQHSEVQERLVRLPGDDAYLDRVVAETFRCFPLFGISHRITTADIPLEGERAIPEGTVVSFDHEAFQHQGWERPEAFEPERWEALEAAHGNSIPFGVRTNRPCPARGLALVAIRHLVKSLLAEYRFESSASHTRSMPNRGPCFVAGRSDERPIPAWRLRWMALRDRWESVPRSLVQLLLGTTMVLDARRLGLCRRHFAGKPPSRRDGPLSGPVVSRKAFVRGAK